jgi:hypothetical protein
MRSIFPGMAAVALLLGGSMTLGGCVVAAPRPYYRAHVVAPVYVAPVRVWVPGYWGPRHVWVRGYWRYR